MIDIYEIHSKRKYARGQKTEHLTVKPGAHI